MPNNDWILARTIYWHRSSYRFFFFFLIQMIFCLIFSNSNTTFWTGLFRQFSYVTSWYDSATTPCQVHAKSTVPGDVTCNHQCVTLTFDNLYDQITLRSEDCNISYSYICYKNVGKYSLNWLIRHLNRNLYRWFIFDVVV